MSSCMDNTNQSSCATEDTCAWEEECGLDNTDGGCCRDKCDILASGDCDKAPDCVYNDDKCVRISVVNADDCRANDTHLYWDPDCGDEVGCCRKISPNYCFTGTATDAQTIPTEVFETQTYDRLGFGDPNMKIAVTKLGQNFNASLETDLWNWLANTPVNSQMLEASNC